MTVQHDDHRQALAPPRFGLRSLLVVISVLCVVLALMKAVGASAALGLSLILLTMLAHVAGASIGASLRDHGSRPLDVPAVGKHTRRRAAHAEDFAPATNLCDRSSLGLATYLAAGIGALLSAAAGVYWIVVTFGDRATLETLAVGALACGGLGAFWAFLGVSFCRIAFRALRHAQKLP